MRTRGIYNQLMQAKVFIDTFNKDKTPDEIKPFLFIISKENLPLYLSAAEYLGIDLQPDTVVSADKIVYVTMEELEKRSTGLELNFENSAIDHRVRYRKYFTAANCHPRWIEINFGSHEEDDPVARERIREQYLNGVSIIEKCLREMAHKDNMREFNAKFLKDNLL
jgi:hypothetical protein